MTQSNQSNPFDFSTVSNNTASSSRRLDKTPELNAKGQARANELIITVSKNPSLYDLANSAVDTGDTVKLIELIKAVYSDDQINEDSQLLAECDVPMLKRLLESQRSNRSKAKQKGLRTSAVIMAEWIGSMYNELLIREQTGEPYNAQSADTDFDSLAGDSDKIQKKIDSLQSKLSRLKHSKDGTPEQIKAVQDDILRLQKMKGTKLRGSASTIQVDADTIRNGLLLLIGNPDTSDEMKAKYKDMLDKIS